jgi:deoxyribose-phosphate aldolase
MNIKQYLDSTYLKTAAQAGLTEAENKQIAKDYIQEAIEENFKLIMIRPEMVSLAKESIALANSSVQIGTVIDFPEGKAGLDAKLAEAQKAIQDGADELDFVCNYKAFKAGNSVIVKEEVLNCTRLGLDNNKVVKWIIEVAALNDKQIMQLSALIKNSIIANFKEEKYTSVFVKSSTGFYKTENNMPNGATVPSILIMLENSYPLPVKAAGGIRTYEEAIEMIQLGVKRIGTSGAKAIANGQTASGEY